MKRAYKLGMNRNIDGRCVIVDVERGRTVADWRPRRLGGGLGGQTRVNRAKHLITKQIDAAESLNTSTSSSLRNNRLKNNQDSKIEISILYRNFRDMICNLNSMEHRKDDS